jgi:CRP/FNR family transcriptional regulator, cyclic AMP receptor protein
MPVRLSTRAYGQHDGAPSVARLLDVDPDLARFLSEEERAEAERVALPVLRVPKGAANIALLLRRHGAFAAIVIEGMLVDRMQLGDQAALRLLGPGDVLSLAGSSPSMLISHVDWHVASPAQLALVGNEFLLASRRWPQIAVGLHLRTADQADRIAAQLAVCQLPRVDQRLLAMMWLLAESWGQVTSVGTSLPLSLTHDVLGELIGARRPTVTLALGELSERGAIVRQRRGWLLVQAPPVASRPLPGIEQPAMLTNGGSAWTPAPADDSLLTRESREALAETVARLRREHARNVEHHRQRLVRIASARERCRRIRNRVSGERPLWRVASS